MSNDSEGFGSKIVKGIGYAVIVVAVVYAATNYFGLDQIVVDGYSRSSATREYIDPNRHRIPSDMRVE